MATYILDASIVIERLIQGPYSAYVALARRSGYPFITVDQPQSRAAVAEGVTLKPITDFNP